jgi:hypothetical protein
VGGGQGVRRPGHLDLIGRLGVGGGGQHGLDVLDGVVVAARVDGGRVAVEAEQRLGHRPADQRRRVELGR